MKRTITAILAVLLVAIGIGNNATAGTPQPDKLTNTVTITVTDFAAKTPAEYQAAAAAGGQTVLGTRTFDAKGRLIKRSGVSAKTGSGGTPSASGCHRVQAKSKETTTLHFTAFVLNAYTDTCWNRAAGTAQAQNNWAWMSDVDSQYDYDDAWELWDGLYYDWGGNNGQPYSAFRFRTQKRVRNCVFRYGCVGTYHPYVTVRTYKDGTYAWETDE